MQSSSLCFIQLTGYKSILPQDSYVFLSLALCIQKNILDWFQRQVVMKQLAMDSLTGGKGEL